MTYSHGNQKQNALPIRELDDKSYFGLATTVQSIFVASGASQCVPS